MGNNIIKKDDETLANTRMDLNIALIDDKNVDISLYDKIPISDIGKIGAIGTPIIEGLQAVSGAGGSGLYMVNTAGGTLFECASKGAYIGGMTTASGKIGQAALTPVVFNPATLCTSIIMVTAMIKLDEISKTTKEILDRVKLKDKSKIKTSIRRLNEIMQNYSKNSDNQMILQTDMIEIRTYLKESMELREEYSDRILNLLNDKKIKLDATGHFNSLNEAYFYYEWSTYVICLAKYMLSGYEQKFDEKTMNDLINEFENYAIEMKEEYTSIYNYIEAELPKSIVERVKQGGEFLMNGLEHMPVVPSNIAGFVASLAVKAGGAFGKKALEDNREKNKQNTLDTFANTEKPELPVFIDKVNQIKNFYNKPVDMLVDKENIYISKK